VPPPWCAPRLVCTGVAQAAKLVLLLLIPEKPLKLLVSEPEATHSLRTTGRRFQRTLLSGEGHLIQSS
jgi:hypothetical protein